MLQNNSYPWNLLFMGDFSEYPITVNIENVGAIFLSENIVISMNKGHIFMSQFHLVLCWGGNSENKICLFRRKYHISVYQ